MFRRRAASVVVAAALASVALTACSADSEVEPSKAAASGAELNLTAGTPEANKARKGTGDWAIGTKAASSQQLTWTALKKAPAGNIVNGSNLALYRFENDSANPSQATCSGTCATVWPPVLVKFNEQGKTRIMIDGIPNQRKAVGVVKRADGTYQLTLGGWPLYRFNQDAKAGDLKGEGRDGKWFAIGPDGQPAFKGGNTGGGGQPEQSQKPGKPGALTLLSDPNDTSENNAARRVSGSGCVNVREDVASAIQDISGSEVKIWTELNCKGRSAIVSSDILDLNSIGFNDQISSVFFG
ncbi:hypothetical protein [Streptomyces sp. NBC_00568]|uniref:hypothetical protein n=1 Tax=Streptomyces sp. NBC_00568 TaxID=2975779 RepID=UPI00225547F7|nr:hypothetical protein [Streptomyces sp. NBC_00568]MCX4993543.1 hypothetical protein [Streptomyces sp. NBC_00568]